tara:strand:- start:772 stop:1689 length:918 start_codon:yes stop_codon:yes gene_type:complete
MSKWIVMGANSFSGKAFCAHLKSRGQEVDYMTRRDHDLNARRKAISWTFSCNPDAEYVVNFAALNVVADSWKHHEDYYRTNVIGVGWFARECHRMLPNLKRFVQVSTPEVYGDHPATEDGAFYPSTPYAVSRAAADMDLMALHRAYKFPVCFTRTVNVFGEGQQPYRIIPKTILKILRHEKLKLDGGGTSERSFIHIDDVALGIEIVAACGIAGRAYFMSGGAPVSIRVLVEGICSEMGVAFDTAVEMAMERTGKDRIYLLDDRVMREGFGWAPAHRPRALADMVAWYTAHADDYKNDSLEYEHK